MSCFKNSYICNALRGSSTPAAGQTPEKFFMFIEMKHIVILLFTALSLVACSKEEVDLGKIDGTWGESYDSSSYAFDGILRYTFDGASTYTLYTSNPDGSSQNTTTGRYALELMGEKTITLNPVKSDYSDITYTIIKLTSKEMAWQKVGTTHSEGTWGSDYRHFVRVK